MAALDDALKVATGVDQRLFALHGHWVTADAVRHHLRRSTRRRLEKPNKLMPKILRRSAFEFSAFHVIRVWYSLLYVVVEGYREIGIADKDVDALLANQAMLDHLRRFRNGTFHYQAESLSPKVMEFLNAKESEIWIRDLNKALDRWLTKELRIQADMQRVTAELARAPAKARELKKGLWRIRFWGDHGRP